MGNRIVVNGLHDTPTLQLAKVGMHELTCLGNSFFEAGETSNARMLLRLRGEGGPSFSATVWLPGDNDDEGQRVQAGQTMKTVCKLFDVQVAEDNSFDPDDFKDKKSSKKVRLYHGKNKQTEAPEVRVEWPVGL